MEYPIQSETVGELAKALCQAQSCIQAARKDSKNPFFNSTYADLSSVTEAIRSAFKANDLAYCQTTLPEREGVTVVTTLMHSSGEWARGFLYIPATKVDAQGFGSAITYGRRYGLAAIAGVVQEDDDGNEAARQHQPPAAPQGKASPPQRPPQPGGSKVTSAQVNLIVARLKKHGVDEAQLFREWNVERIGDLQKGEVDAVLAWIERPAQ